MLLLTLLCPALAEPIVRFLPAELPQLQLDLARGVVLIRHDEDAERAQLILTAMSWAPGCSASFSGDVGEARVLVQHSSGLDMRCRTMIEVVTAGQTGIALRLDAGEVHLSPTPGRVELDAGAVQVSGSSGSAHIHIDQGQVRLMDLSEPVEVRVGVGAVTLAYTTPPAGLVQARVDIGSVHIAMPEVPNAQLSTSIGAVHNLLVGPPAGDTQVRVRTGMGSIWLEPARAP